MLQNYYAAKECKKILSLYSYVPTDYVKQINGFHQNLRRALSEVQMKVRGANEGVVEPVWIEFILNLFFGIY